MRRRSRATATRTIEPRLGESEPTVMVGIPVVVGACMYGQLFAFRAVKQRSGLEAFRVALGIQFLPHIPDVEKLRAQLTRLGALQFARVWHLLVAYVDRVGVMVALDELHQGLIRNRLDA